MKIYLAVLAACIPAVSFAVECNSSCGDGEVMVSYADGNNVTCECVRQSAPMNNDTSENPEGEGLAYPDGEAEVVTQ